MTRTQMFIVFFSVVLVIYGSINSYIYIRGLHIFPHNSPLRVWFTVVFWFLALSYIAARIIEHFTISTFSEVLVWIGSFWMGAMVYFFIILLAIDILWLANHIIPFFPEFVTRSIPHAKKVAAIVVIVIVFLTVLAARINSMFPRIQTLDLTIEKQSPLKELNAVVVTDVHLGTIICNSHFIRIVEKINSLDPDIVLFAGDLVDEDIEPVIRQNLGETLRQIKSKYGLYGITGNHEYIGGVEPACEYLTEHGVIMLRDSVVLIDSAFTLVGREDISARQFGGSKRRPLNELMKDADRSLPVILMDHQPSNLNDAVENGIDLQLSGHTHHGQLWPFNFISKAVYELSWGYMKKGDTHIYVSCGVGTWGPPMRTGNRPEIVNMRLKFGK